MKYKNFDFREDRRYVGADYAPYGGPWAHEYGASERSYPNSHPR